MATLSVVIPVYNEQATIEAIVGRVLAVDLPAGLGRELVLVDDRSTDATWQRMAALPEVHPRAAIRLLRQDRNRGKGAALRVGLAAATGDLLLIQDADLEYDPADYPRLLAPILSGRADVVYGSRFRRGRQGGRRVHYLANRVLTCLSNLTTGLHLTDMETCYKVFRRAVMEGLTIRSDRFNVEPELTAKMARGGWRVVEVPISYAARGYAEGKKIGWRDGVSAIRAILRYALPGRKGSRVGGLTRRV